MTDVDGSQVVESAAVDEGVEHLKRYRLNVVECDLKICATSSEKNSLCDTLR